MKALVDWIQQQIALITAILGIIATVWGWWKFVWSKKKARDRLQTQLATGDRIAASADLEGEGYDDALRHYENALALDPDNVDILRRIARCTLRKNEMVMPVALMDGPARKEIDALLVRLYDLGIDTDVGLLLEQAGLLDLIGKRDSAVAVLRKAKALAPDDPEVLVQLGSFTKDLEMVRRALEARPDEGIYHHALAYVLRERGEHGPAVREYRRAAELATRGSDLASRRTHAGAMQDLLQMFKQHGAALGLPVEERVAALEALVASRVSLDRAQHIMLAELYAELGRLEKARDALRLAIGDDKTSWRHYLPQLKLYVSILERGGFDPAALAAAQAVLQEAADAQRFEQLMETYKDEGHRYKVGLRVEKAPGDGVLVQRSFAGYPFAKAGVRDGDRILEFAHRKIARLQDISRRLVEFTPGTDLPLRVDRAGGQLDLTLIVE